MTLFEKIIEKKIPVSWGTLWIGWAGPNNYQRLVTLKDVTLYAVMLIESEKSCHNDVYYLAGVSKGEEQRTSELIKNLAINEDYEVSKEERKWRLILLEAVIENLPQDPLYGILELIEFWSKWNFPSDSPIKNLKTENKSQEFYTEENYLRLRNKHLEWMLREEKALKI